MILERVVDWYKQSVSTVYINNALGFLHHGKAIVLPPAFEQEGKGETLQDEYLKKMLERASYVKGSIHQLEQLNSGVKLEYQKYGIQYQFEGSYHHQDRCIVIWNHYDAADYSKVTMTCLDNRKVVAIYNKNGIAGLYVHLEKINQHIRGAVWAKMRRDSYEKML